ncbi:MAG: pyruvate formate lyase family protein [Paludibacter sp.]|nr:pyruvate formate lyase family protein [Paludibacter sp.]
MKKNRVKFFNYTLGCVFFISFSISAQEKEKDYFGRGVNYLPSWIDANQKAQLLIDFNHAYKSSENVALREAACIKAQYKLQASAWQPGDLFGGRITNSVLSVLPQPKVGYVYSFDEGLMNTLMEDKTLSTANKDSLVKMKPFWSKEQTMSKLMNAYPPDMKKALPSNDFQGVPGVAFPLYRIAGTQMDFDKLVRLGIPGLQAEIEKFEKINTSAESQMLYKAMHNSLNTFIEIANYYATMIELQKKGIIDKHQLAEMDRIILSLKEVTNHKPNNFYEAIQLCYLYAQYSGTINYGRIDEYLGDLYQSDLEKGTIVKSEAIHLFSSLFKMMESNHQIWDTRAIVGGKGRRNEKNADQLALVIMEAMNKYRSIVPQLTLRFYEGQNKQLYKTALDIIGSGYTYPMLYNDDVIIPSVQAAFNVSYDVAINYLPYGCGEYIIYHKSIGTPSAVINLLQALNVTLHNGVEPLTGEKMGLSLGNVEDYKTFDELMVAYKKQVEYYVTYLAIQEALEYKVAADNASLLYLSMLFDDCIANGKALLSGGVRYLGGTLEAYGNTNTADALTAIKLLVYDQKILSLKEVVRILDKNFVGYDIERNMMLNAPKYGNDNNYADSLKVEVDRHVCEFARDQNKVNGLHSYLVVSINNSANTQMGLQTAASADGRQERTYMANANTPTGGVDKNGITAMLNSIIKPSTYIHAGAVQNMKFSKELFVQNRDKVEVLLNSYWRKGGAQAMLTVLGRGDLEDAMKHPDKYTNLIVRVGGFCARFVELPRSVQLEVLSRTMY